MRKPNPRFGDCPGWVVLVLAVFLGAPSTRQAAIAQSACFDYAQLPHLFGQVATPGQIQSMACRGDYIYVAAHTAGLHAIDARNAQQPLLQSTYDSDGEAYDVAISGTFAVLADGSRGLVVLNLGQPWNPVRVGWLDTVDHLRRVALAGDHTVTWDGRDDNGRLLPSGKYFCRLRALSAAASSSRPSCRRPPPPGRSTARSARRAG